MYKLSVPIGADNLNPEYFNVYLDEIKKCKAQRVFLAVLNHVLTEESVVNKSPELLESAISFFKGNGIETGVWISALGHGIALTHEQNKKEDGYTQIHGVMGDSYGYAYCPSDERFAADYAEKVALIAKMKPDIIMLDDDFRLNTRQYYMGCFCPIHLEEYYKRIGERIPREKLEKLIFSGGKNKYRSEYMKLSADTLLGFAKKMRKAVDTVDESIRLGACTTMENWDFCGTDCIEIAKAFAGNTKPFLRTAGAPYWNTNIIDVIEETRQQVEWCKNTGVEIFTEGDTYPRPRYNVSSRVLELFDLAFVADGNSDGILKYMFDYLMNPDYEKGYAERHIRNESLRRELAEIFAGKRPIGVKPFNALHKIENWVLGENCESGTANRLINAYRSTSSMILSRNSIPTAYGESVYPLLVFGENARYISESDLKNGAIIDAKAAEILQASGIDTGLISFEPLSAAGEYFINEKSTVHNIQNISAGKVCCNEKAEIISRFEPNGTVAAYKYENKSGTRFFVLCFDYYSGERNPDYFNNYYRRTQLEETVEWVGRKPLPALCRKNPNLYMIASSDGKAMSVVLFNIFLDEIEKPEILLDICYDNARFINCTGTLDGNKITLSEIQPYGMAAFEVSLAK